MDAKEIIVIGLVVIVLGGLAVMFMRNRRKYSEAAKRPACFLCADGP